LEWLGVEQLKMRFSGQMRKLRQQQAGMSILELLIAMIVLAIGIVGTMPFLVVAIGINSSTRQSSNSTALAQMVTEKITSVGSRSTLAPAAITITDCAGTAHDIATTDGGSTTAHIANYFMLYTDCGTAGRQRLYDVRWTIKTVGDAKQITVWARLAGAGKDLKTYALPVTISTIIGP
jgi:prepilin-type N-terminal cleavage/methylation domain-containing protein